MFNLQSLVAMASQAMLQNANPEAFQKFLGGMLNK